jgi:hypothetical protein
MRLRVPGCRGPTAAVVTLMFCLAGAVGCSRSTRLYPVRGTVLYQGQPAVGAVVVLHPPDEKLETVRPNGYVDASGQFVLSSYRSEDGAPPGDYIVTVVWPEERSRAATPEVELPRNARSNDRLKGRYSTPANSTLRATVHSAPTTLPPIELQ